MIKDKYALAATVASLVVIGGFILACGKDKKSDDQQNIDEALKTLEALGKAAETLDKAGGTGGTGAGTTGEGAKLSVQDDSVNIERTKYSTVVYCYVSNDGSEPSGASVKATFKDAGGSIIGTASGSVGNVMPGRKKPVQLYTSDKVPSDASVKVEIENVYGYGFMGEDDIATSNISVKKQYGYPKVMGEVTNKGTEAHSISLYASFHDAGGKIIGYAFCSAINDMEPGTVKTFDCSTTSKLSSWDKVEIGVASLY